MKNFLCQISTFLSPLTVAQSYGNSVVCGTFTICQVKYNCNYMTSVFYSHVSDTYFLYPC